MILSQYKRNESQKTVNHFGYGFQKFKNKTKKKKKQKAKQKPNNIRTTPINSFQKPDRKFLENRPQLIPCLKIKILIYVLYKTEKNF